MKCELVLGKCGSIVASLGEVLVLLIIDPNKESIFVLELTKMKSKI